MTIFFLFIDVFIGKVHTAAESDLTINYEHFSVVTIIESTADDGHGVETHAFHTFFLESLDISGGVSRDTSNVIIHEVDFNTFLYFLFHYLYHGIPHNTVFNDKIFGKNEFFSLFKFFKHDFVHFFTECEISCTFISDERESGFFLCTFENGSESGVIGSYFIKNFFIIYISIDFYLTGGTFKFFSDRLCTFLVS